MVDKSISSRIQKSKFLVTGGAGFIGSHLIEELVKLGAQKIVILDDLSTGSRENIAPFLNNPNVSFFQNSIVDYESCLQACNEVDVVFQLAALGSVPRSIDNPIKTNEINVVGFLNVLNAAREKGVQKVVFSSSSSIYGNDPSLLKKEEITGSLLSPYAVSKKTNELYAEVFRNIFGMNVIGLRYFNVFGPRQSISGPYAAVIPIFINNLLNGKPCYINGDGGISRDFTYVKNVVKANLLAAFSANTNGSDNAIYNIAMGNQLSLNQLYDCIEKEIKSGLAPVYREPRLGDILSSMADISKAKECMGFMPEYSFEEGIKSTIDWYRGQLK